MRTIPTIASVAALGALRACMGETILPTPPATVDGPTPVTPADPLDAATNGDAEVKALDAGGDATQNADAATPCRTGERRSETRFPTRVRSLSQLAIQGGSLLWSGPAWLNLVNARTSDDLFTSVSFPIDAGGAPNGESLALVADRYGFAVPRAATIDGIEVHLEWRGSGADAGSTVRGGPHGLTKGGILQQATGIADVPTTEGATRFGDASALWGTSWDPADVNDPAFGTAVSVRPKLPRVGAASAFVDTIGVTVTYVCP